MKLYSKGENYVLIHGDMLNMAEVIKSNTIDAIVCDPPYELNFMGKGWDNAGVSFQPDTWKKCYEALKPGGYLLAFGGTRTFHRIACAIEDAGFEIRDTIMWLYGSGFPKSMNIGKKLDGWNGWGTALKPAYEPIIVARKPFKGSCVANVMEYGVGGINIDECRVGNNKHKVNINDFSNQHGNKFGNGEPIGKLGEKEVVGRFPANVIHDGSEEVCANMPNSKGGSGKGFKASDYEEHDTATNFTRGDFKPYNDDGSASRYFYCAKASKKDRDEGLDEFESKDGGVGALRGGNRNNTIPKKNNHPTVKPTSLMQYLVRLVTPKGGTVLDPFMGSGSTGKAVMYENKERNAGYKFIGIELTEKYLPIAEARIKYVEEK